MFTLTYLLCLAAGDDHTCREATIKGLKDIHECRAVQFRVIQMINSPTSGVRAKKITCTYTGLR